VTHTAHLTRNKKDIAMDEVPFGKEKNSSSLSGIRFMFSFAFFTF
jgi:hypothetical protein